MDKNVILLGNCLEVLKTLPDKSVNCCVTSPPYYGLRDYGTAKWIGGDPKCPHYRTNKVVDKNTINGRRPMDGTSEGAVGNAIFKKVCPLCGAVRDDEQVGIEETPEEYVEKLVSVFHEIKRMLTDDGTCWINIGDSYAVDTNGVTPQTIEKNKERQPHYGKKIPEGCKPKDMIGIPWMLAFALRADGWYLRQDIIWAKPNPMPESVKDRCTKSHEYIFLLSKSEKYYFDNTAIQEQAVSSNKKSQFRNKRDVWVVSPSQFKSEHFATYPEELIYPCVVAGCPEDGIVIDPFMGSGTTGIVAKKNRRNYIGVELNPKYKDIADKRLENTLVEQVDVNNRQSKDYGNVHYVCGDSTRLSEFISQSDYDMLLTSPPYYNLEEYSKSDMSASESYRKFMLDLTQVFYQCYQLLKDDTFTVVKVGEVRDNKTGEMRGFVPDTINMMKNIGWKYYNEIILINQSGTAAIRSAGNMKSRKIVKCHQNVLVFYKGDTTKIKDKYEVLR